MNKTQFFPQQCSQALGEIGKENNYMSKWKFQSPECLCGGIALLEERDGYATLGNGYAPIFLKMLVTKNAYPADWLN